MALSNIVELSQLREKGSVEVTFNPTAEECKALAQRFQILDVKQFSAKVLVKATAPDLFRLTGWVKARVVQECIVNGSPVSEEINEQYDEVVTTSAALLGGEDEVDGDNDRPVELIEGDSIDVAEIAIQWLALSLDPYPRSDAPLYEYSDEAENPNEISKKSPFAVLETLKRK